MIYTYGPHNPIRHQARHVRHNKRMGAYHRDPQRQRDRNVSRERRPWPPRCLSDDEVDLVRINEMGRPMKSYSFRQSFAHQQAAPLRCSESDCPTSVTVEQEIAHGERVIIKVKAAGWLGPTFRVTDFVYSGTKDLWIIDSSAHRGHALFPTDTHLDSFRAGAPSKVDWGVVDFGYIYFHVENRSRGKNARPGHFIARLVGFRQF